MGNTVQKKFWAGLSVLATLAIITGCNIYGPLDSPTSRDQLLSAARACLDDGDYACAREYYNKLPGADADIQVSELAFTALDEAGAGMKSFMSAFGKGKGVSALNKLAEKLAPTASSTKRLAIYNDAYIKHQSITNSELKNLVRFLSATALAAEILAEAAGGNAFAKAELVATPTTCAALTSTTCNDSSCDVPVGTGSNLTLSGTDIDLETTAPSGTDPTLEQLNNAITQANTALQSLGVSGSYGATNTGFTAITSLFTGAAVVKNRCFRWALLSNGIGE